MEVEQVQNILVVVVDGELTAVEFVEGTSLWLEQETHHD